MTDKFRVGITKDFLTSGGESAFGDIGLGLFDMEPNVSHEFFAEYHAEATPDQIASTFSIYFVYRLYCV